MSSKIALVKGYEELCEFDDPVLCCVVTLREACLIWSKSETTIRHQMIVGNIHARKSFTGGDWLLSYHSIVNHYGKPLKERDYLCHLLK